MVNLLIQNSDGTRSQIKITGAKTTIGRHPDNDIYLADDSASIHHAEILLSDHNCILLDLNSSNGTKVNGKRIAEAELHDGDTICFASVKCQFKAPSLLLDIAPPPVQEQPSQEQNDSFDSKLAGFGKDALAETKSNAQLATLNARIEKLSRNDVAKAHHLARRADKLQISLEKLTAEYEEVVELSENIGESNSRGDETKSKELLTTGAILVGFVTLASLLYTLFYQQAHKLQGQQLVTESKLEAPQASSNQNHGTPSLDKPTQAKQSRITSKSPGIQKPNNTPSPTTGNEPPLIASLMKAADKADDEAKLNSSERPSDASENTAIQTPQPNSGFSSSVKSEHPVISTSKRKIAKQSNDASETLLVSNPPSPTPSPTPKKSLTLYPRWASLTGMSSGGGSNTINDLKRLLSPLGKASDVLIYEETLLVYEGVTYLMPLAEAKKSLGLKGNASKIKIACAGFPDGLFYHSFDGHWGQFNRMYIVTDVEDKVASVELVEEAPKTGQAHDPTWHTYDFVNARVKAKKSLLIDHKVENAGSSTDCVSIKSILYDPDQGKVLKVSIWHVPKPLISLILHCVNLRKSI